MEKISVMRNHIIIPITIVLTILMLAGQFLIPGNIFGQRGELVEEMPDITLPSTVDNTTIPENKTTTASSSNKSNLESTTQNVVPNVIRCSSTSNPCNGTDGDDTMLGDSGNNRMFGGHGQDNIIGYEGDDGLSGGPGGDYIVGLSGSDVILGLDGNDLLFQDSRYGDRSTDPDGQRDLLYCGEGYDEAWINKASDNDAAYDCEVIHETDEEPGWDVDKDSVPTNIDNCPTVSNNSQMDRDGDGLGDPCDPNPFNPTLRDSKVTVRFDSITVHNKHESTGRGSGEWDLVAYVQGQRVLLTEASGNMVCGSVSGSDNCFPLWYAENGDTYYFDKDAEINLDIPEKFPLSIFTAGSEVDECGRDNFLKIIPDVVTSDRPLDLNKITKIQNDINQGTPKCFTNDPIWPDSPNDILGLVNKAYDLTPGQRSFEVKSSTGDFTLRYTVNVIPP